MEERKEAVLTVNEEKIKKNKKNDSPKWESDSKNLLVKILIVIGLILCIFGFLFLSIWFTLVRYRVELLKEDSKRPWVKELASKLK